MSGLQFEFLCDDESMAEVISVSVLWWLSFIWITRHIWSPEIERLAENDRYMTFQYIKN